MGKYMKKSKLTTDVAVMEVVGVRTRAKTLALKQLQSSHDLASLCYLQLRNRRLEKPAPPASCRGDHHHHHQVFARESGKETGDDVEVSFGDNCLDSQERDRATRESTPCSFIRDPSTIVTPGSTTRRRNSMTATARDEENTQITNSIMHEVEEFFAYAEQQQQRQFMEKYNFDMVNDMPLPGPYEWVQIC